MELNFPKLEEKILKFWKENKIFEKSIQQRKKAPDFVFYEGPPTANARAGLHHVLARVFKDIICRYKTMRGFRVLRKAGWDTHGLPVELEIEKKLGFKSKKDIEKYGIAKFNKECKKSVWLYKKDWEKLTERIGFWLDMENPYITYDTNYIETVWWILKEIYKKRLLYQDFKVVPYCPRCQTSLSSHEVALGYKKIKEPAIYVKLNLKSQISNPIATSKNSKLNTYLLVWTTTPWTLPGNVAVAVSPEFTYAKVKVGDEFLILAKERIKSCGIKGEITQEFKGKDLLDLEYEPLFPIRPGSVDKKAHCVIPGDFVSLEEGTGLVHIAPAFGEEDMEAIKAQNAKLKVQNLPKFPILLTVDEEGEMKTPGYPWDNLFVKEADPFIVEDLKKRNLIFKEEIYEHDYPFCWRCDSPLLYYAKKSWFIRMQKVKKELIKNNQKINWIPAHLKEGRFGEWLRDIKDWALSRERFWGTPLPIWCCQIGKNQKSKIKNQKFCDNIVVIGSREDLLKQKFSKNKYYILRHGETIYQTKKKKMIYPWPEVFPIFLTKNGRKQIKEMAKKLKSKKIDLIYSSDVPRTRQTAEIVAKELGVKIILDKRLRDINLGIYHGRRKEEFYRVFPNTLERFQKKPPKGESWSECKMRMINFLKDIDKKYEGKKILIISHGDPLWLLEGAARGLSNEELLAQKQNRNTIRIQEVRQIEAKFLPYDEKGNLDPHRPYIDEVKFYCPQCGQLMERVPEVIDCWFDSGAMPFAQAHFPFVCAQSQISNLKSPNYKNLIKKILFPADYISEGVDQTRGWFYTLLAISTLLGLGPSYKNVISLGLVLDERGEKMSKSKRNVVDPWQVIPKYGSDALRWYFFTVNQPGDSKLFSEKEVAQALKKFIMILWNSYVFFRTYAIKILKPQFKKQKLLDKWVISRLNELIYNVTKKLDKYDVTGAARAIEDFVIGDLSQWYIRRSRRRFHSVVDQSSLQSRETTRDYEDALQTLAFVLLTLSKLTAPFTPFLSDYIYRKICNPQSKICNFSVHLEDWPKANRRLIDKDLNRQMELVRSICSLGLKARKRAGIKVRQPLALLEIKNQISKIKKNKELINLIKEELNVKEIKIVERLSKGKNWVEESQDKLKIALNVEITPELREEGMVREVIRQIQEMRKEASLKPHHGILIEYLGEKFLNEILEKNKEFILRETKAKDFVLRGKLKRVFDKERETKVDQQKLWLGIKKFPKRIVASKFALQI